MFVVHCIQRHPSFIVGRHLVVIQAPGHYCPEVLSAPALGSSMCLETRETQGSAKGFPAGRSEANSQTISALVLHKYCPP